MEIFGAILFFATIVLPLLFQILFGSGIIPFNRKIPFGVVCIISVPLWFGAYYLGAKILSHQLKQINSHDGMPFVGLMIYMSLIAIATVITMLIQLAFKYKKQRQGCR